MPLAEFDTIQSALDVLRRKLAEENATGDFTSPLAELAEAVRVLAGPGTASLPFAPGETARGLDTIWLLLVEQERLLRRHLLDAPEPHPAVPIALASVSRAVNGILGALLRRRRNPRA